MSDEQPHILRKGDLVQHRTSNQWGTVEAINPARRCWPVLVRHDANQDRSRSYSPDELWYVSHEQKRLPCRVETPEASNA